MYKPETIIWIFTAKCNLNCPHCYTSRFLRSKELSLKEKLRLIDEMGELGIEHVGLSGGEPLIHPELSMILRRLYDYDISISLVTNACIAPSSIVELLATYDVYVYVSIDGPKNIHDSVRGLGTFEKVLRNVEKLRKYGIDFGTVMAISKINYKYVKEYLELALKLGATYPSLIPVMPSGKAMSNGIYIESDEYVKAIETAVKFIEQVGYPISLWCTPFAPLVSNSRYIYSSFCRTLDITDIDPSGNILACDIIDYIVTNIRDRSLAKALEDYINNEVIKEITEPPKLPEPCLKCPLKTFCRSGCFARAFSIYGDFNAGDPLCPKIHRYRQSINNLIKRRISNKVLPHNHVASYM